MKKFFKNQLTIVAVFLLAILFGCQKESELKTASNVRVHEITTISLDSADTTYWYVFFKNGKFIHTKRQTRIDDFSSTFFLSSKKIPEEIKFAEEFVRSTLVDSGDTWGFTDFDVVELQDADSNIQPDSNIVDTSSIQISDGASPVDTFFVEDYQVPDTISEE